MKFEMIHPCPPVWLIDSNPSVANWVAVHGTERSYDEYDCTLANAANDEWEWADVDARVQWAAAHEIGFRGHTLVWSQQNPGWLTHDDVTLSPVDLEQIMHEHIQQVIGRYCAYDNVYAYDVVNEALSPDGSLSAGPWLPIPNYIDKAFRIARAALDSCGREEVKLYYNDWDFEYGGEKTDKIYDYLSGLLQGANPTPIDGIGFQTHSQLLNASTPEQNVGALITTMNRFSGELGLEVAITETDLAIQASPPADWYDEQAQWYSGRMRACLLALNCTGFTTWGTHDGSSWWNSKLDDPDPLMFQDASELIYDSISQQCGPPPPGTSSFYCPKPAYGAVYDALVTGITKQFLPIVMKADLAGDSSSGSTGAYPPPNDGEDQPVSNPYPMPVKP